MLLVLKTSASNNCSEYPAHSLVHYLGKTNLNPFLKCGIKNRSTEYIHDRYRLGVGRHCVRVHTAALGAGAVLKAVRCDGIMKLLWD